MAQAPPSRCVPDGSISKRFDLVIAKVDQNVFTHISLTIQRIGILSSCSYSIRSRSKWGRIECFPFRGNGSDRQCGHQSTPIGRKCKYTLSFQMDMYRLPGPGINDPESSAVK